MIRNLISCLACCMLLLGCSNIVHLPTDYALPTNEGNASHSPIGRFSVHGTSTDPDHKAPNLCAYFFRDFLRGFDIDNIEIVATEDSTRVLVQPYVGAIPVTETMLLKARTAKDGTVRWGMETPTGQALATQILGPAWSFLNSMGSTVFLYGNENTELLTDEAGALIIAYSSRTVGVGLLAPRVSYTEKRWYRYEAFTPVVATDEPTHRETFSEPDR